MDNDVRTSLDNALPEALRSLRRLTGFPVAFGGATRGGGRIRQVEITGLAGALGTSLSGLRVSSGLGLGGVVLRDGTPRRVSDYAGSRHITHDYDAAVRDEHLTSVIAVPVIADGVVRAVLYGAIRDRRSIGDRALRAAEAVAAHLQAGLRQRQEREDDDHRREAALAELAAIAHESADPDLRARLAKVHRALSRPPVPGRPPAPAGPAPCLSPRERDVLRLVAVGATNLEVAAELRLSPETVKAYLRHAMRRLGVHNRSAAVHTARSMGVL